MLELDLTIKNFRCFNDSAPVNLALRSGATALLGTNNSGKSSLLRMFFELRPLLGAAASNNGWTSAWLRGLPVGFGLAGVPDPQSILHDRNNRPMTLRIDCPQPNGDRVVSSMEFTFPRHSAGDAVAKTFIGPKRIEVPLTQDGTPTGQCKVRVEGGEIDFSHFAMHTDSLRNTLYVGPFRNILNQSTAPYYDLNVGTAFVSTWDTWKNGHNRAQNLAVKEVERAIAKLFGFRSLEINPSTSNDELRVFVDGQPFALHEQGAGLAQFIITFGIAATRSPSLILIDEPELNLHPSLQIDFLSSLATFASDGVLFATHSMGLARSVADTIYSLQQRQGHSVVSRYETTPDLLEFAGELSFSAYREFGYDRILLVEGPTDVRTIQQLLKKLNKDHKVVVFPLLGHAFASGEYQEALIELRRIAPMEKIAVVVDSERAETGGIPDKKRQAFAAACEREGFKKVLLTERRSIENYFPRSAVQAALGERFDSLGPFEKLGTPPSNWSKKLNWKIAHAMELHDLEGTDLLEFLHCL